MDEKTILFGVLGVGVVVVAVAARGGRGAQVISVGGADTSAADTARLQLAGSVASGFLGFAAAKQEAQSATQLATIGANRDVAVAHETANAELESARLAAASQFNVASLLAQRDEHIAASQTQLENARLASAERVAHIQSSAVTAAQQQETKRQDHANLFDIGGKLIGGALSLFAKKAPKAIPIIGAFL